MRLVVRLMLWAFLLAIVIAGVLVWVEVTRSPLQARYFTELGRQMRFAVEPGPSAAIRFPKDGPFDRRLGYTDIPDRTRRLLAQGYEVAAQARLSPKMLEAADRGLYLPYREKTRAGLEVLDCTDSSLFRASVPQDFYADFESVPPLVVQTLLFIEDRGLLSNRYPTQNPAVDWGRLLRAIGDQLRGLVDEDHPQPGGSTLATQIEKYRHSPRGVTDSPQEKLRQMASASLRAYLDGPDTSAARRRLVVDYLNTVPLAARPGYGEVIGVGDGLRAWYGSDFAEVNRLIRDPRAPAAERGRAYRQVLSLMIAQRRPSALLLEERDALARLTDGYLRLLERAGIIDATLRDAALTARAAMPAPPSAPRLSSFVERKAANLIRTQVAGVLGVPRLYDLDRLDLMVESTLDATLQERVTAALRRIATPAGAATAGLLEPRLLAGSDPAGVTYSFLLYENTPSGALLRVQTDSLDQPLDSNEGTRLDLGSTAKLRTLVTYLEIVARLHERLEPLDAVAMAEMPLPADDEIARWAAQWLSVAAGEARSLPAMLEAALERRYSASPDESFLTGGGVLRFSNFDPEDDDRVVSVREAFQRSINLPFVRLMRDIVRHTQYQLPTSSATLLEDESDPRRREYLARFAEREGRQYLRRFYRKYAGREAAEIDTLLLQAVRPTPRRLAAIHRYLEPAADVRAFGAWLRARLGEASLDDGSVARLYRDLAPGKLDLADRAYVAGVHPLELWLAGYLRSHGGAGLGQVLEASAQARQGAYAWLFRTRSRSAQDQRIRTLLELEAFEQIHRSWERLGYPFAALAPSYATALGSSADRPSALATLVGILLNDGVRARPMRIGELRMAQATPYETHFVARPAAGERVLHPAVAAVARGALVGVVEAGTARRLAGAFRDASGQPLAVGGKTGTGDNRFKTFGRGGTLLSSRVVSRSGTLVFFIGDRHFGTVTAWVKGPRAADYRFTSALPTQVLRYLAPTLEAEIQRAARVGTSCRADAPQLERPPREASRENSAPARAPLLPEPIDTAPALPEPQPEIPESPPVTPDTQPVVPAESAAAPAHDEGAIAIEDPAATAPAEA